MKKVHFQGLTGLRGIAAIVVVISHLDQFHYLFGYQSFGFEKLGFADDAVTFFFVLSGFLITYLLLQEKANTGTINVRFFYMRRILRIWPAYFLAIIISLLLMAIGVMDVPNHLMISLVLYLFFFANAAYALALPVRTITPLWSVGVEEQFYAIWPWIIRRSRNVYTAMWCVIAVYLTVKIVLWFIQKEGGEYRLIRLTRIDSMAIGGLIASVYYYKKMKWLEFFYKKYIQIAAILICLIPILFVFTLPFHLEVELKTLAYAIIILNVATNDKVILSTNNQVLNFFGEISYGMYVYHMIIIFLCSYFVKAFELQSFCQHAELISLFCLVVTVGVSYFSYQVIEQYFLKFKQKYKTISES